MIGKTISHDRILEMEHPNRPETRAAAECTRRIKSWPGVSVIDQLSYGADGKRLACLKVHFQSEVRVAEFDGKDKTLKNRNRFTSEDSTDRAVGWTPDGKALFITSNRNGNLDIFRQKLGERTAQPVIAGPEDECNPVVTPDGKYILYFDETTTLREASAEPVSLKHVPIAGGPSTVVHREKGFANAKCARAPSDLCVVDQRVPDQLVYLNRIPAVIRSDFPESDPPLGY